MQMLGKLQDGYKRANAADMAEGKFRILGQLLVSSICMSGPAPNFFEPWIYKYMVFGLHDILMDDIALKIQ